MPNEEVPPQPAPESFDTLRAEIDRLTAALAACEHRHSVLIEASPTPILLHRQGKIVYLNPAALRLWRAKSADEVLGRDLRDYIHPNDRALSADRSKDIAAGKSMPVATFRLVHPEDGTEVVVESQASAVTYQGEPAILVMARDVTERRLAEQARLELQARLAQAQKMEAIGRMAGGIAHDFNNMLTVIVSSAELAKATLAPDSPAQRELTSVLDAARRSTEFARQLLAFSRKRGGLPQKVDFTSAIPATVSLLRRLLGDGVLIRTDLDESIWPVFLDPGQLDQILANFAVNARDAMGGAGHVKLSARNVTVRPADATSELEAGDYIRVDFADDGCGMDERTLQRVFEPYFTTKPAGIGTGLGLSTVRDIIGGLGGAVSVTSRLARGTCFTVHFPRHDPPARVATQAATRLSPVAGRILVVDDDPTTLETVAQMLRHEGYIVFTAASPDAALGMWDAQGRRFDLLLTDVVMPSLDGDQLAPRLVAQTPTLKVLYMSGYPADLLTERLQSLPGAGFLPKPFTSGVLSVHVRRLLDAPRTEPTA